MEEYDDWKIRHLRAALLAFYARERDASGKRYNWETVWNEILDYGEEHGIELNYNKKTGPERLRKFVMGEDSSDGKKYPVPMPNLMAAIAGFIVDENPDILSLDELNSQTPPWYPIRKLVGYLQRGGYDASLNNPKILEGVYKVVFEDADGFVVVRTLNLQAASKDGLIEAIESEELYPSEVRDKLNKLPRYELKNFLDRRFVYRGWAIFTPEHNLLIYLKESVRGINRHYLSMASDVSIYRGIPARNLILLDHVYPDEPTKEIGADQLYAQVMDSLKTKLLHFSKW